MEEAKQVISTNMNKSSQLLQAEEPATISTLLKYRQMLDKAEAGLNNQVKDL